jgi:hypothetical protein
MRSALPKFASNKRQEGTPEENRAIVQGDCSFVWRRAKQNEWCRSEIAFSGFRTEVGSLEHPHSFHDRKVR